MCTSPEVKSSSPAIIRNRVDFPHPEGPTKTVKDPSSTARSMPWITSSDWKLLRTPFSSSLAICLHSDHQPITRLQPAMSSEQDYVTVPLRSTAVHGGDAGESGQPKSRDPEFAAMYCQRHGRTLQFDHTPALPG